MLIGTPSDLTLIWELTYICKTCGDILGRPPLFRSAEKGLEIAGWLARPPSLWPWYHAPTPELEGVPPSEWFAGHLDEMRLEFQQGSRVSGSA